MARQTNNQDDDGQYSYQQLDDRTASEDLEDVSGTDLEKIAAEMEAKAQDNNNTAEVVSLSSYREKDDLDENPLLHPGLDEGTE